MATQEQRDQLRRMTGEQDSDDFTDAKLDEYMWFANDDIEQAAADIWNAKANAYADLTDISEAGSSRKNSVLYERALERAKHYQDKVDGGVSAPAQYSTTRPIVRP